MAVSIDQEGAIAGIVSTERRRFSDRSSRRRPLDHAQVGGSAKAGSFGQQPLSQYIGPIACRKSNRRSNMKVLMILTSHDELGNTGRKTGFWLEELAAPYYAF